MIQIRVSELCCFCFTFLLQREAASQTRPEVTFSTRMCSVFPSTLFLIQSVPTEQQTSLLLLLDIWSLGAFFFLICSLKKHQQLLLPLFLAKLHLQPVKLCHKGDTKQLLITLYFLWCLLDGAVLDFKQHELRNLEICVTLSHYSTIKSSFLPQRLGRIPNSDSFILTCILYPSHNMVSCPHIKATLFLKYGLY